MDGQHGLRATPGAGLRPAPLRWQDVTAALRVGWRQFRVQPLLAVATVAPLVVAGSVVFLLLERAGLAPLSLSLAGGFMLLGPALLAGFFAVSDCIRAGGRARYGDWWRGFRRLPRGGWAVSFVCALLFLIWITDAGILYGFMVGRERVGFAGLLQVEVLNYAAYSALMGGLLAFILFAVSAFSIPLLYDGRAQLVAAVVSSVRAVFARFAVVMGWALLMAAVILLSAVLLPLLLLSLPVAAYASRELYFRVFPGGAGASA